MSVVIMFVLPSQLLLVVCCILVESTVMDCLPLWSFLTQAYAHWANKRMGGLEIEDVLSN
jgi:hypothetical protein